MLRSQISLYPWKDRPWTIGGDRDAHQCRGSRYTATAGPQQAHCPGEEQAAVGRGRQPVSLSSQMHRNESQAGDSSEVFPSLFPVGPLFIK